MLLDSVSLKFTSFNSVCDFWDQTQEKVDPFSCNIQFFLIFNRFYNQKHTNIQYLLKISFRTWDVAQW